MKNLKKIHILIIIIGSIFVLLNAFHSNLWVDESYSIALAKHSFVDIWKIGSIDVHPTLYYWLLHIILLIVEPLNNPQITIIVSRLFSSLAIILLGIIGYTHIRKDFGKKAGIIFSILVLFMPTQVIYSQEIRMYTWLMFFVTMTSIYAQKFLKNTNKKNIVLFTIFNLLSAYTHYYGLLTSILINLVLFISLFIYNTNKKNIITFIISFLIQLIIYLPWIPSLINQTKIVSNDFWISFTFPKTIFEVFEFQFTGNNIGDWNYIAPIIGICFGIFIIVYSSFILTKEKKKESNILSLFSIVIYITLFTVAVLISFKTPILYPRYILVVTGLLFMYISMALSKLNKNKCIFICFIVLIFGFITNVKLIKTNYDSSNMKQIDYLKENIEDNDIIIYSSLDLGSVYAINFPNVKQYLYSEDFWVIDSYKAYNSLNIVYSFDELKDYVGTIWIIDPPDCNLFNRIKENNNWQYIESKEFNTAYRRYSYRVVKMIKNI